MADLRLIILFNPNSDKCSLLASISAHCVHNSKSVLLPLSNAYFLKCGMITLIISFIFSTLKLADFYTTPLAMCILPTLKKLLILDNKGRSLACKFKLKDADTPQPVDPNCLRTVILKQPSASTNPETQCGSKFVVRVE